MAPLQTPHGVMGSTIKRDFIAQREALFGLHLCGQPWASGEKVSLDSLSDIQVSNVVFGPILQSDHAVL